MMNSLFVNKASAILIAFSILIGLSAAQQYNKKPGEPGLGSWEQCGGVDKDGNAVSPY
jgi:hypothetical protein